MEDRTLDTPPVLTIDSIRHPMARHFISTRVGGLSKPPFHWLNLGLHVGDDPADVLRNRAHLMRTLSIPVSSLVLGEQVHGAEVAVVGDEHRGCGATNHEDSIPGCDALVTNTPGVCLAVLTADCVPILLLDPLRRVISAVHAGWRGTVLGIARRAVKTMVQEFGCSPKDVLAGMGPSVGPCCYKVGQDVAEQVQSAFDSVDGLLRTLPDGTMRLDLREANRRMLRQSGLREDAIHILPHCTCCRSDLFFSVRAENGPTGRFATGIMLAGP
ncbi:MAG: peptidoglycan editing factor PgeF [Armatimonadota bacterium]